MCDEISAALGSTVTDPTSAAHGGARIPSEPETAADPDNLLRMLAQSSWSLDSKWNFSRQTDPDEGALHEAYMRAKDAEFCFEASETVQPTARLRFNGQNFGLIGQPDVEKLLASASPAVFGRKKETVLDPSFRTALQIAIELDVPKRDPNDYWSRLKSDQSLPMPHVAECWGLYGRGVHYIPSRVHIYREGDFFKSHVDTPHSVDHFGSALVFLPTAHEGGVLEVTGPDGVSKCRVEPMDSIKKGKLHYATFYADCQHVVEPVTSGIRICIQYDLYWRNLEATKYSMSDERHAVSDHYNSAGAEPVAAHFRNALLSAESLEQDEEGVSGHHEEHARPADAAHRLVQIVEQWLAKEGNENGVIALMLSHGYVKRALDGNQFSGAVLKGSDAAIWHAFEAVAKEKALHLELAAAGVHEQEDGQYDDGQFADVTTSVGLLDNEYDPAWIPTRDERLYGTGVVFFLASRSGDAVATLNEREVTEHGNHAEGGEGTYRIGCMCIMRAPRRERVDGDEAAAAGRRSRSADCESGDSESCAD